MLALRNLFDLRLTLEFALIFQYNVNLCICSEVQLIKASLSELIEIIHLRTSWIFILISYPKTFYFFLYISKSYYKTSTQINTAASSQRFASECFSMRYIQYFSERFREKTYSTISYGIIAKDLTKIIRFEEAFSLRFIPFYYSQECFKLWIRTWDN